jgi:hypothetical protein
VTAKTVSQCVDIIRAERRQWERWAILTGRSFALAPVASGDACIHLAIVPGHKASPMYVIGNAREIEAIKELLPDHSDPEIAAALAWITTSATAVGGVVH